MPQPPSLRLLTEETGATKADLDAVNARIDAHLAEPDPAPSLPPTQDGAPAPHSVLTSSRYRRAEAAGFDTYVHSNTTYIDGGYSGIESYTFDWEEPWDEWDGYDGYVAPPIDWVEALPPGDGGLHIIKPGWYQFTYDIDLFFDGDPKWVRFEDLVGDSYWQIRACLLPISPQYRNNNSGWQCTHRVKTQVEGRPFYCPTGGELWSYPNITWAKDVPLSMTGDSRIHVNMLRLPVSVPTGD
jgi:hypothetical protein